MGNVVSLNDHRPHNFGPAKCLGCKHEWYAVVLAPEKECLECPECGKFKGEFVGNCSPPEDELIYQCQCGCDQWFVLKHGVFCRGCGATVCFEELV